LYRYQTEEIEEARYKEQILLGIKRKYNTQVRNAMKVGMEQISLFLLLLSAAYKSNLVSIIYMGILCSFLISKNKTKGMQTMTLVIGTVLILQYLAILLNLTSLTSPYSFPPPFTTYPNMTSTPEGEYLIPLFLKSPFL
jgi:hypothetical protein